MIRPITRLTLRVAALALAATLLATASASAATYVDWKPGQRIVLTAAAGSTMRIVDSETFGDPEIVHHNLTGKKFGPLGFDIKSFKALPLWCGGGEVRGQLHVEASTSLSDRISVKVQLNLFEGTSCSTEDFDGHSDCSTGRCGPARP